MEEPYLVCHQGYYEYLMGTLSRLDALMDTHLVLAANELASVHGFVLAALSSCIQALPRVTNHSATTYILLRELDPWGVRCILEYFHSGALIVPKQNLPCMNSILQALDISLGSEYYESEEAVHFSLSQTLKASVIDSIWLHRERNFDVKILTKGMHEAFAHAAILSACSEQLSTLFRASHAGRPSLIVLLDFHLEDVECLLRFCYKGEVEIARDRAPYIGRLAKILGIKDLYSMASGLGHQGDHQAESTCAKVMTKISCWEHRETTRKIFRTLFEKESLSDIQLICSDHTFKVHSAVLNLSPYFKPLFELSDWRHSLVFLSELSLDTVQAFVDYMYYGEVLFAGGLPEFAIAVSGLIDFSMLPANNVEPQWDSLPPEVPPLPLPPPFPPVEFKEDTPPVTEFNNQPPETNKQSQITDIVKETINNPLTYTCDTCSAIFYSRRSLKLHLKSHPESHNTQCQYCEQTFTRPSLRKIHERTHTGVRPHFCDPCGKAYASQSALSKHVKTVHGEGPHPMFECAVCGRTCSRKEYLEEHIRTHTGKKPYRCDVCGKGFVGRTGLNHHSKIHEPPRKDSVCEVCGKAFTRKSLWTHMKIHDKQYECEVCHKFFATPGTLRAHTVMTHIESKLFTCQKCGKKFALKSLLNRHQRTVHNRNFPCSSCDKVRPQI
jgi:hypothetical protein